MGKRSKVFLPAWVRWFAGPLLAVLWAIVTYRAWATPEGREELGLPAWLGVTLMFALVGLVLWLMTSGKLPVYIIEAEDEEEEG